LPTIPKRPSPKPRAGTCRFARTKLREHFQLSLPDCDAHNARRGKSRNKFGRSALPSRFLQRLISINKPRAGPRPSACATQLRLALFSITQYRPALLFNDQNALGLQASPVSRFEPGSTDLFSPFRRQRQCHRETTRPSRNSTLPSRCVAA